MFMGLNPDRFRIKGIAEKTCDVKEDVYIPFGFSDAKFLLGKEIKSKSDSIYSIINYIGFREGVLIGGIFYSYEELLIDFTFLDDTPCGKLKTNKI